MMDEYVLVRFMQEEGDSMPRRGQTVAECAQSRDHVLCAIVDAHRAGRYPSAALIARVVGLAHSTVKTHINTLRDAHLLTARYGERHSLTITPEAFTRRDLLVANIPVFPMPQKRRQRPIDRRIGGIMTLAMYGRDHYRQAGHIGGSHYWRNNPGAAARLAQAQMASAAKRKAK